jgi:hypothetical protein
MAFKMNGSPMNRNFGIGDPDNRAARRIARLARKGKLVASEYMTPTDEEGVYDIEEGGVHSSVTDPKGVVTGETSTQYKVSKKGKIKKEV